jgi:hypothetical protein
MGSSTGVLPNVSRVFPSGDHEKPSSLFHESVHGALGFGSAALALTGALAEATVDPEGRADALLDAVADPDGTP